MYRSVWKRWSPLFLHGDHGEAFGDGRQHSDRQMLEPGKKAPNGSPPPSLGGKVHLRRLAFGDEITLKTGRGSDVRTNPDAGERTPIEQAIDRTRRKYVEMPGRLEAPPLGAEI